MATTTIGNIGSIEGSVEVVHADGTKGSLEQGAPVYADDAVTTGENSNARIEFLDGSAMNIGPEFTAILDKDVFDPALLQEEDTAAEAIVLDSSDREVVPESGLDTAGKEKIGSVEKAEGVVEAVGEDGIPRMLDEGDELYANDVIRVDDDGSVSIKMVDGTDLSFGPGTLARMGDSVTTVASSEPSAVPASAQPAVVDAAQIAAIIQEGRDPTEEAAAPAAGEAQSSEGAGFTVIEPSHRAVTPTSGHDTHGFELPFSIPEPYLQEPEEEPGDAGVVTASASGPDSTVYEAGLPGGSTAGDGRDTVTGSFTIKATDCIKGLIIDSEGVGAGGAPVAFSLPQIQGFNGTQTIDMGEGILTLTGYSGTKFSGKVDYSYTLKDNIDNDSLVAVGTDVVTPTYFDDTALITVKGDSGSTGSDELVIRAIDDLPTANDDGPETVTEDVPGPGNMVSGDVLTNDVSGADIPKDFVSWTAVGQDNTAAINALNTYGTLVQNGDGTWDYTLDNSLAATQALDATDNLSFDLFYTMKDEDGDTSDAKLTIKIDGADDDSDVTTVAATGPDNTVNESGLVPDGSTAGDGSDADSATFTIKATDGIDELVIGGTTFTLAEVKLFDGSQTVDTGEGILKLNSYTGGALGADFEGTVGYTYTLKATLDNDSLAGATDAHFDDSVLITVKGVSGTPASVASDDLVVRVIDDEPTANDDTPAAVTEDVPGAGNMVSGNVLTNDVSGADTPKDFVSWTAVGQDNTAAINALNTYGTLVQNGDGTWDYTLDNSLAATQALDATDNLSFDLFYTMQDEDGDTSEAKLTIKIDGADDDSDVTTAAATGPDNTVNESGLVPDGSTAGDGSDADSATFTIKATDGIDELVIGGTTFTLAEVKLFDGSQTVDTGEGILKLNSYTGGALGADFEGTVGYTYTLKATLDNDSLAGATDAHFDDSVLITVKGVSGTPASVASDDLVVRVIDDEPTANDDTPAAVTEDVPGAGNMVSGNVLTNDVSGADTPKNFDSWETTGTSAASITELSKYGTLVQNPTTGAWSYTLNNSLAATQALDATDNLSFDLFYTMKDEDGDTSDAKLTIKIDGADDDSDVTTAAATGPDNTVNESGLVPDGSTAGDGSDADSATFTIKATDGIDELVIGGTTFTLAEVKLFDGSQTVDTGEGILKLNSYTGGALGADFEGTVGYTYTLKATLDNDSLAGATDAHFDDSVLITVKGVSGTPASVASDDLVVRVIDDEPTANDDTPAAVTEDVPGAGNMVSGNVLTNDVSGADTPKNFDSWETTGTSAASITELSKYGTLVQNPTTGAWSYTLDNSLAATQALDATDNLSFDLFYTMKDEDGDTSDAKLTIKIDGADDDSDVTTAAATGPDNTVNESGLVPDGSTAGDGSDADSATFTIKATDGIDELVIGGTTFTLAEVKLFDGSQTVDTGEGILKLNSYTGGALGADFEGTVGYTYTLKATLDNDSLAGATDAHFDDSVLITVKGVSGTPASVASDDLVVRVIDDEPTANDDTPAAVTEDVPGAGNMVSGNVLTNDVSGADTPKNFDSWETTGTSAASITELSKYGTLVQNPTTGAWSYTLNNSLAATQALDATDNLSFDLFYTMKDEDGDTSDAKLTIKIDGADDDSDVTTVAATGPDNTVNESGLVPDGSTAGDGSDADSATFTIKATDGIDELVIGGTTFTLAEVKLFDGSQTVDTGEGILKLNSYTGGALGADFEGTVGYTYTLKATLDNDSLAGATDAHFDDSVLITVKGVSGTPASVASDDLVVRVIDDEPTALNNIKDPTVAGINSNIVIMFDRSGSMEVDPGVNGFSERIDLARAAVVSLLAAASSNALSTINVLIVDYGADAQTSGWITGAQVATRASDYLATLAASGSTNYEAATQLVQDSYGGSGFPGPADQNIVYFLSDGEPTSRSNEGTNDLGPNDGDSDGLTDAEVAAWETFLTNNSATAIAVGIGNGTDLDELNEIAFPDPALEVTNESQLIETLLKSFFVNASGNVLTDVPPDVFGADVPGQIVSIKIDTGLGGSDGLTTFVYDPNANAGAGEITNEDGLPVILGSVLVVTTKLDGELTFYFEDIPATADQGDYSYEFNVTPANSGVDEVFEYVIEDADGDQSTATLTIEIPLISDLTGLPLIAGDNGNNTLPGTDSSEILAGDDGNDTLNGLGSNDLLFGGDGDDILNGGAGNDTLIGDGDSGTTNGDQGFGNDVLDGGAGIDLLVGARGADTLTGGADKDIFVWNSRDRGTGSDEDTVTDFNTGEGDVLNIADLLVGEESLDHSTDALLAAGLDSDYISISIAASATVTLYTDGSGSGADQVIQMTGFNTTGFANSAAVIESLLAGDNLVVD